MQKPARRGISRKAAFSIIYAMAFLGAAGGYDSLLYNHSAGGSDFRAPSSFGEDADGEFYICDIGAGAVYKMAP